MNFEPSPLQTLLLWRLLVSEGGEFWKYIKPNNAKDKNALEAAGLVKTEKRKESQKKGARPVLHVSLTEAGWDWAASHLDAEFSQQSSAAGPVLHAMLRKLKVHLARTNTSLADFIAPPQHREMEAPSDVFQRVRDGYCQASGGRWNVRVRLADLRRVLADVARPRLDDALFTMEREGTVVMYPLDDPQETGPEDEAAGLPNSLGIRRHIMYMER